MYSLHTTPSWPNFKMQKYKISKIVSRRLPENITISEEERKEGGDELTGVNWGPVDPATHQATKIACGVRTWIEDVQFFQK